MQTNWKTDIAAGAGSLMLLMLCGWLANYLACMLIAAAAIGYIVVRLRGLRVSDGNDGEVASRRSSTRKKRKAPAPQPTEAEAPTRKKQVIRVKPDPSREIDTCDLVDQMLDCGRYALLLRHGIISNLESDQLERAMEELTEGMSLTAAGDVCVSTWTSFDRKENAGVNTVAVDRFLLDRYPVTNAEYQQFVDAGGYDQESLWDEGVWETVVDFLDSTGEPGPRFWADGEFAEGEENHPVTGINWHEASAYASWVGKRLPTDAEWVKAASWPQAARGRRPVQRRFPWGDAMEKGCANMWGEGIGEIVPVDKHPRNVTAGGVFQMTGNVWEWTHSSFGVSDLSQGIVEWEGHMKSIRGGAYDTYFDMQGSSTFQSGDDALSRKHNIGFRCAIGVNDLALEGDAAEAPSNATNDYEMEAAI